ncbi:MAG TPA: ABC transporter permease [Acidimicrobiia bacterium]|nr:ABC transporter permease [Acidimicrobiia bacterium]
MDELIGYVVRGIPFGCVFGLVAVGLVLTYKTSGVFNLAFAAQAFASAAAFYTLRKDDEWGIIPAFVVSVVVLAPLLGFVLDRFLFRHLRTAPTLAKLVTSLGLLVAGPEIVRQLWFGSDTKFSPPSIWPGGDFDLLFQGKVYAMDGNQAATMIVTVLVVIALSALFRYSAIGLQMRAVVESPRMTALVGVNPNRVSAIAWMLSSFIAGLAGVLLAPLFAQTEPTTFTTLLVAAIAAAAFGRLTSIPLALLGGILLGVLQGILAGYLPPGSILAAGLRPSLPFVTLFLLLLFWPGLRRKAEISDPLAGADPPPPGLAAAERSRALTIGTRTVGAIVVVAAIVVTLTALDVVWMGNVTRVVIYALIFLSITVITGMAGQISLCQASFAAAGGFTTAQLSDNLGSPIVSLLVGVVVAAIVGALLALPSLRLGGIYLALATLAFALMFDSVLVPIRWIGGGQLPTQAPRPGFLEDDRVFFLVAVAVLVVVATLVVLVRRGTTGKFLDALRGSETAAASLGINAARSRILAFALSAGIAGLGGGLLTIYEEQANYGKNFSPFLGLFWVVLVVTLGARTVEGAVQAGLAFALFPEFLELLGISSAFQFVLFGLAALTYAKHPEGLVEYGKRRQLEALQRWLDRGSRDPHDEEPDRAAPPGDAMEVVPS